MKAASGIVVHQLQQIAQCRGRSGGHDFTENFIAAYGSYEMSRLLRGR